MTIKIIVLDGSRISYICMPILWSIPHHNQVLIKQMYWLMALFYTSFSFRSEISNTPWLIYFFVHPRIFIVMEMWIFICIHHSVHTIVVNLIWNTQNNTRCWRDGRRERERETGRQTDRQRGRWGVKRRGEEWDWEENNRWNDREKDKVRACDWSNAYAHLRFIQIFIRIILFFSWNWVNFRCLDSNSDFFCLENDRYFYLKVMLQWGNTNLIFFVFRFFQTCLLILCQIIVASLLICYLFFKCMKETNLNKIFRCTTRHGSFSYCWLIERLDHPFLGYRVHCQQPGFFGRWVSRLVPNTFFPCGHTKTKQVDVTSVSAVHFQSTQTQIVKNRFGLSVYQTHNILMRTCMFYRLCHWTLHLIDQCGAFTARNVRIH